MTVHFGVGVKTRITKIDNTNNRYYAYPVQIDLGDEFNGHILRTYDGLYHVVAMLDNGRIISWGANSEGQLGQGIDESGSLLYYAPDYVDVFDGTNNYAVDISVGALHTLR